MDPPKTRAESKKTPKEKARGKSVYSAKHIRIQEAIRGSAKPRDASA